MTEDPKFQINGWDFEYIDYKNLLAYIRLAHPVLQEYEKWEADLVECDEVWDTEDGLPKMTQALHDRFMAIQEKRNKALSWTPEEGE